MPEGKSEIVPDDVIEAGNRFADLFGDGRQGYVVFDIAVLAIMEERERNEPAVKFSKEILRGVFDGCDIDGFGAQELGVQCGVLEKVAFDPAKHRDPDGLSEKGDWWFEFAGPLAVASSTEGNLQHD